MNAQEHASSSILVIRLGALGDVANVLPAVAALRRQVPEVRIAWLVEEPGRDLLPCAYLTDGRPVVDEVILFPRKRLSSLWRRPWKWPKALAETLRFINGIRARRHTSLLDFQGNLKSGVLGLLSGAGSRIGFARAHCREMNWLFNSVLAMPASRRMPRTEKYAALAQVIAPRLVPETVSLKGTDADAERVEEFLAQAPDSRNLVVIHPGSSAFGDFKRWPAERFGQLARKLAHDNAATCIITHGPAEDALARTVQDASNQTALVAPALTVGQLIELLRRARLFIAGDTGPLHVAALLRTPMVAIFGPKDPAIYAPYTDTAHVVRKEMDCSPCTRRRCDHVSCIMTITVADVLSAAQRMLQGRPPYCPPHN